MGRPRTTPMRSNEEAAELAWRHRKLAARYAAKIRRPREDFADLNQAAFMGLMRAAKSYNPALGYTFSTYASGWMKDEIRLVRRLSYLIQIPAYFWSREPGRYRAFAEQARREFDRLSIWPMGREPKEPVVKDSPPAWLAGDPLADLAAAIDSLTERQRAVIERRLMGLKPRRIAEDLGIARRTVCDLEHRGIEALRKILTTNNAA